MNIEDSCISCIDTDWSYQLARRMEKEKTNPVLGYRTAGSAAETATGDMLYREMKAIGLTDVTRDTFSLDGWEFEKAVLKFTDDDGQEHTFQMGGYQTNFETDGFEDYELVYLGKGTAADYEGINVKGKLVMVEINQRDEWWISFPVYQAYLRGAAALIAVQANGYGEIAESALNAQDIAGPDFAPAFSLSQADARILKRSLRNKISTCEDNTTDSEDTHNTLEQDAALLRRSSLKVSLDARSRVIDSKYDWSTGAYNQVFRVHPDWQGKVIADLNFELPAHAHNRQDAIRCTYEYADFIRQFTDSLTVPKEAYPDGITVLSPIETWSDDFSMAIAGIPSTVNDFSAGPFMQNYYHSQYDNQDVYQEAVYQFHHECYLKLIMAIDRLVLPPMNFSNTMNAVAESIHENALSFADPEQNVLLRNLQTITASAENIYDKICQINTEYATLSDSDARIAFRHKWEYAGLELLKTFRKAQDYLVRLNWQDEVIFPQEAASKNIRQLEKASRALSEGNITDALKALYRVDNNMYAFLFDEEVYYHFTEYILHQPKDRLMWGAGRIMHHENLYGIVQKLKQRMEEETPELDSEIRRLEAALRRQKAYYKDDIRYLNTSVNKLSAMLDNIYNNLLSF